MKKFTVEMSYIVGVSLEDIEAETREEAIKKAKEIVKEKPHWYMDVGEAEFEQANYVQEE